MSKWVAPGNLTEERTIRGVAESRGLPGSELDPAYQVANMIPTATAIVAVDSHPIAHSGRGSTKAPMTSRRIAISMMTTINGTATTPLITADQNSALIGSKPTKLMSMPIGVDTAMVP